MDGLKEMLVKSKKALEELRKCSQDQVDDYCIAIGKAIESNAEILAKEAVDETGIGNYEHKVIKNFGTGGDIWTTMKGKKSVGVIDEDKEKGLIYIANPKGVIGSVSPTTNPTITPLGNSMVAIKGRNTIIIAPHPSAKGVSTHTVKIMNEALQKAQAPENIIQIIENPTIESTQELMSLCDTVIATGGMGLVRAAYSSGKPAYGVGAGNVQHIIADDYDDIDNAVGNIIFGRSLDNGIICAGDQSIIYHKSREKEVIGAIKKSNAYFTDEKSEVIKLREILFDAEGHLNKNIVGKSAKFIAELVKIKISEDCRAIVIKVTRYGRKEVLCSEKMCPVIAAIAYDTFEEGIEIARENLIYAGSGHSAAIHTNSKEKAIYAGLKLPVSRLLVNQPGLCAGGAGLSNWLNPTISLGCGSWGGNSISENLTYKHLINISRIAYPRTTPPPSREEIWTK